MSRAAVAPCVSLHIGRYQQAGLPEYSNYMESLSDSERAHMSKLPEARQQNYVHERGILRILLGAALGKPAASLEFEISETGKPGLKKPGSVFFNLSHSHDIFVVAISTAGEIGVDIERNHRSNNLERVALHYFPEPEIAYLTETPDLFEQRFIRLWTLKEAIGKWRGIGVNKTFLKNATSITESGCTANQQWLGERVATLSLASPTHLLSLAVAGDAIPPWDISESGWQLI